MLIFMFTFMSRLENEERDGSEKEDIITLFSDNSSHSLIAHDDRELQLV